MLNLEQEKKLLYLHFLRTRNITDQKVLEAFLAVPREDFLPKHLKPYAYEDNPLPIGKGQTISQPTTVLLMTQWLQVKEGQKILEIGTGSGYQAAILRFLVGKKGKIITIERIKELYQQAKKNLAAYGNVHIIHGDGSKGYERGAPYDKILITAAPPVLPIHLLQQLKKDGRILAPVGEQEQQMMCMNKKGEVENLGEFLFVPLTGKYGVKI